MIPKIKKILYATDLSQNSAYVFNYALNSAEMHDAKIDILYVAPPIHDAVPDVMAGYVQYDPNDKSAASLKIKKRLDDFVQLELKDNPDKVKRVSSIQVIAGNPVVEILDKADELKAEVIIMGTHSKGLIAHTFLGSVATNVLQRTKIPVFIIPIPKA